MKRILQWMFLLVLIGTMGTVRGQSFEYDCDFETDVTGWTLENGTCTNQWVIGTAVNNTASGSHALYITNDGTATVPPHQYTTSTSTFVCAYKEVLLTAGVYDVSYKWMCVGEGSYDYLRVALVPGSETIEAGSSAPYTSSSLPIGWIALDGDEKLKDQMSWETVNTTATVAVSGTYKLAFCWKNDGSGGSQPPAGIDDITFRAQTCPTPYNFTANDVTSNSANISWTELGSAIVWQIEYGPAGFTRGSGTVVTDLYESSYSLTNLLPNTAYDVYVESVCEATDISNALVGTFRTDCGVMVLPSVEDFNSYGEISFPTCWFNKTGEYNEIEEFSAGNNCLQISDNGVVYTPQYNIPANEAAIYFQAQASAPAFCGLLEVGYVTDPVAWDYVPLKVITPVDDMLHWYEVSLEDVSDTVPCYIVFSQSGGVYMWAGWYLDNVEMFRLGECRSPKGFSFTNITATAATLNWNCSSEGADFEIKVEGADTTINVSITDGVNSYTLDNLNPNSIYSAQIRTMCSTPDSSHWIDMGSFETEPLCDFLTSVTISPITTTTATINWIYSNMGNDHTGVHVKYKSVMDADWIEVNATGNSCFLTGLMANESYDVEVSVACGTDTSSVKYMSFSTPSGVCGEAVGAELSTTNRSPYSNNFMYSYTQAIYMNASIEGMDTIKGVVYHSNSASADRAWVMYMANTSKSEFSSETDFLSASELTEVYNGAVHFRNGWDTIMFTTPFVTNGTDNIVIAVEDTTGMISWDYPIFTSHTGSALYQHDDYTAMTKENVTMMIMSDDVADARFIGDCRPITCKAPSVACASSDATSISLAWLPGMNETSWKVEYRMAGAEDWIVVSANTTDTTATVTNLVSSTAYEFRVGALCTGDTLYGSVIAYTTCGNLSIPMYENFSAGMLSPCWRTGNMNLTLEEVAFVTGNKMRMMPNTYVVLPEASVEVNTLQLRFNMNDEEGLGALYVGVVSEQNSITTFVPIDTVYADPISPNTEMVVPLDSYEGTAQYIALIAAQKETLDIDNFVVEALPACPQPLHVHVDAFGGTTLTLGWDASAKANSWSVVAVPTGNDIATGTPISVSENSVVVTGLSVNTTYDVYVGAICTDGSSMNTMMTITTLAADPLVPPFTADFTAADVNTKWSYYATAGSVNKWAIGTATSNGTANALYVTKDDGVHNAYNGDVTSVSVAYIPIQIPEDGRYALTYDWKSKGESTYDFGRVALVSTSYDFTTMPTLRFEYSGKLPTKWIAMDGGVLSDNDYWSTKTAQMELTAGTYYLTAFWTNDNFRAEDAPLAIDNISMIHVTCAEPMDVTVSDITANSATVSWRPDASIANGWEVWINDEMAIQTPDTSYTFTDLTAGMGYTVSVRSLCSDDDMSLVVTKNFFTSCSDITSLPYSADFNAETPAETDSDPHCWMVSTDSYPSVSTEYSETPALHFYCYETSWGDSYLSNVVSMPKLSGFNLNELELQFDAKSDRFSDNNVLYVGVCKSAGDLSTCTPIDTIEGFTNEWGTYVVSFADYTDTGKYITFYAQSAGSYNKVRMMVDNILLQKVSPCARPTTAFVESYTYNSAVIGWTDTNTAATFNVAYSVGSNPNSAENVISDIASSPYTITGLESATTYNVWVAADCSNFDTISGWVNAGEFTTDPDCAPVTDFKVIDIDETHATLTWCAPVVGHDATKYVVRYQMNANDPVFDTVQTTYYFMSNLATDSTYYVSITTICNEYVSSVNSATFVPSTPAACTILGQGVDEISGCPIYGLYNYGFSQMLFKSNELGLMGDTIRGVTFNGTAYSPSTRTIKVYMGETSLNAFGSSYLPTANMTLVYEGAWSVGGGVSPIDFETEFIRTDRSKNIVLTVDDNTGGYDGTVDFAATDYGENLAVYSYVDGNDLTSQDTPRKISTLRPNVVFDADCMVQTCFAPSVVISNVTDTQIDLAWRAGNDETSWKVEYRIKGIDAWTVAQATTTATTASLTNLLPGHDYEVRVGAICGVDVSYRTLEAATLCGPMPLPFYEDFDLLNTGDFAKRCWTIGGASAPHVSDLIGNGHVLRLMDGAYVALPEMRGALNTLQIRLRYIANDDSVWSLVGYMENPNMVSTFHVLDTIRDYNNVRGYYHTVKLNSLPANAEGYIAVYTPHNLDLTFIDDITVEPIRSCVEPTNVVVSNITTTTADVAWTGTASSYMVEYGPARFEQGHGSSMVVNGNNAQLTNLNAGTMYDIYVHSICGAGDTSYATNVVNATTDCAPISELPYVMNFEEGYLPTVVETGMLPLCWTAYVEDTNATETSMPQIIYDESHSRTVNGDYILKLDSKSIVAMPEMSAALNTMCVRFNVRMDDEACRLVVGTVDHVSAGFEATFIPIDTIVPASVYHQERYALLLDSYTGTGKHIAFRNIDMNPIANNSVMYLDSVVIDVMPTCPEVSNMELIAVSTSTLTFDWTDHNSNANSWEVEYGEAGFDLGNGTKVIVASHPATILGLDTLTSYDIWVRPICGEGDTGFFSYRPFTAMTSVCDAPSTANTAPNGPTGASSDYPIGVYWENNYSQTIIDARYLSNQTDISAFRFTDSKASNGKVNNCRVWMGHTTKTQFDSETDWVDADNLQLVYTGDFVYEAGPVTILLDSAFAYDGSSNLIIAVERASNNYQSGHSIDIVDDTVAKTLYQHSDYEVQDPYSPNIDGVLANGHPAYEFISCGISCPIPILSAVTDLTFESATINWVGIGTDYEVAIRPQDESTMSESIAVNGNTYTFTGLIPNVDYVYYVRQVCDTTTDLYSIWAEGLFTTEDLPCFAPTNVTEVGHTAETITISWTPASEDQTKWSVHVFNTIEDHVDTVTENPITIMGLTGGQTYKIAVNAICATNYVSEWSDTIEVTTTDCLPVSGVAISEITANSAKVTWTAGGDEASWEVNYGEDGFGQGQGEFVTVNTNSYVITGLEVETPYDVYVRANCSEDFNSVWSDVVKFTTIVGGTEGIDGVEGEFNFVIYPNPTSGATTISLNGIEGQVTISVIDMNGRAMISENIECGRDCEKRIDVAGLAQGTYFVRVLGDNINSVRKLIVR